MELLLDILIIIFLLFIFFQDYKFRGISWMLFPIGFILLMLKSFSYNELFSQTIYFISNVAVLLIVFIALLSYFSIKSKKLVNIIDRFIGIGDLFFLFILALSFSFVNFILFINIALFFILIVYGIFGRLFKFDKNRVPFAGLLALFYCAFFIVNEFILHLNPYEDLYFFELL